MGRSASGGRIKGRGAPWQWRSPTAPIREVSEPNGGEIGAPSFGGRQVTEGDGDVVANVSLGEREWGVADGTPLTIGRQSTCDAQVGGAQPGPEDCGVSRRALTVICAQGRTWIRNDSTTQPVYVRPEVGEELVLERRGTIVSLDDRHFTVVLEGQVRSYALHIERLGVGSETHDELFTVSPPTIGALTLTLRERRLLAAICEPLFSRPGVKVRPASYREAATRLGLSEHTVRNQLDALRERLLTLGIPRLIGAEAKNDLARYAVRSGSITPEDVAAIDTGQEANG
jgi:hypothetical protein